MVTQQSFYIIFNTEMYFCTRLFDMIIFPEIQVQIEEIEKVKVKARELRGQYDKAVVS